MQQEAEGHGLIAKRARPDIDACPAALPFQMQLVAVPRNNLIDDDAAMT